jgi:hypothetical protein
MTPHDVGRLPTAERITCRFTPLLCLQVLSLLPTSLFRQLYKRQTLQGVRTSEGRKRRFPSSARKAPNRRAFVHPFLSPRSVDWISKAVMGPGEVSGFNRTNDLLSGEGQIAPLIRNKGSARFPHLCGISLHANVLRQSGVSRYLTIRQSA